MRLASADEPALPQDSRRCVFLSKRVSVHDVHTRRVGAIDQLLDHGRGDAPPLTRRRNRVAELDLAMVRLTLEPAEADQRAIVVEEQMRSPRILGPASCPIDGGRKRLGKPDPAGHDRNAEAGGKDLVALQQRLEPLDTGRQNRHHDDDVGRCEARRSTGFPCSLDRHRPPATSSSHVHTAPQAAHLAFRRLGESWPWSFWTRR
jgi:hypothetical protein